MSEHEGRVEDDGSGAWHGVATARGQRWRVRFVLPGERVRVRERANDPGFADLVEVLDESPHRREPACGHFGPCGGCQLLHVVAAEQLAGHVARAKRAFAAAQVALPSEGLRALGVVPELGHRHRARFQAAGCEGRQPRLGFHETGGREVRDIASCPLLTPELDRAWTALREALAREPVPDLTGLEVTALPGSPDVLVLLNPRDRAPRGWPAPGERLLTAGAATGVAVRTCAGSEPRALGARSALGRTPAGRPIAAALGGFVQASAAGADRLCEEVVRLAEPAGRRVLELHGGAGLLGHALAEAGGEVRSTELDSDAVEAARRLPAPTAGSLRLEVQDACEALARHGGDVDGLVTDPPRSGLGPELGAALAEGGPALLVGAWCSLRGLEADLQRLRASHRVTAATVLGLFPQTRHCEVVARLERR